MRAHKGADEEAYRVLRFRPLPKGREDRPVQTRFTMDIPCRHPVPDHGPFAACIDRNFFPAQPLQNVAGVAAGVVQGLVPSHDGDAQKLQLGAARRQHEGNGVVVPGVAVVKNLLYSHKQFLPSQTAFAAGCSQCSTAPPVCRGKRPALGRASCKREKRKGTASPPLGAVSFCRDCRQARLLR